MKKSYYYLLLIVYFLGIGNTNAQVLMTKKVIQNDPTSGYSGVGSSTLKSNHGGYSRTAQARATQVNYTYVGSFMVGDGQCWSSNPVTYTGQEAAALLYGGSPTDYAISVNPNTVDQTTITHTSYVDGYADTTYLTTPAPENFKLGTTYNLGVVSGSFSAFVHDHSNGSQFNCYDYGTQIVNYVWRIGCDSPAPTGSMTQTLCQNATISDLTATGTAIQWYDVATGGTALASTTLLSTGIYYATQTLNGCESPRFAVSVTISPAPTASIAGNSTLTLTSNVVPSRVEWYGDNNLVQTVTNFSQTLLPSWGTTGNIIAGNGTAGSGLNQLSSPGEHFIDSSGNIYVSDRGNSRVVKWAPNSTSGTVVASGLSTPVGVWVDNSSNLFVVEYGTDRVTEWTPGSVTGIVVAGGNGAGSGLNQFSGPHSVYGDNNGHIYVTDQGNNRVVKWTIGAATGVVVADGLGNPQGIYLDNAGTVYVAEINTSKVTKWVSGSSTGITVAGGNGSGGASNQLSVPIGVTVDANGNVYVSDWSNYRVVRWEPNASDGTVVMSNLTGGPLSTRFDSNGNLTVLEEFTNKVTSFPVQGQVNGYTYNPTSLGSYYAIVYGDNGCSSISNVINVTSNTPAPTASAQIFCNNATVANLTATGSNLQWYDLATGGTALASTTALATGTYYVSQTISGLESDRTAVSVTVYLTPSPTVSSQIFCFNATVANLTATGTAIQWYNIATGGTALASGTALATGTYYVTQTSNGCESARVSVSVIVNTLTLQQNTILCPALNSSVSISIPTNDVSPIYTWEYRVVTSTNPNPTWIPITSSNAGAVYTNYTTGILGINRPTTALPARGSQYRVTVSQGSCNITSSTAYLYITSAATAGIITPSATSVCSGNSVSFALSGYIGTSIQWQNSATPSATSIPPADWTDISGATDTSYTTGAITAASNRYYRAIVTNGCLGLTATTSVKGITVTRLADGGTIIGGGAVCLNSPTNNIIKVTGYVGAIQWQYSTNNGATWTNAPDGTSAAPTNNGVFTTTSLSNSSIYYVSSFSNTTRFRVSATSGDCPAVASSNYIIYTITTPLATSVSATNNTVCYNTSTLLTLATGYVGTIKWVKSIDNWATTLTVSGTTQTVSTGNIAVTTAFKAVLTVGGNCVTETAPISINVFARPIAKPISSTTVSGSDINPICTSTFKVLYITSGYVGNIQWEKAVMPLLSTTAPLASDYSPITGATAQSYTVTNAITGRNYFRVKFTIAGCTTSAVYTSSSYLVYYTACRIAQTNVAPNSPKLSFDVIASPNPYSENFNLSLSTSSDSTVGIMVYDMIGRLIEQRKVKPSEIDALQIGNGYPSGVYNIIVDQGTELKTLRVVKR